MTEFNPQEMDNAAVDAENELSANVSDEAVAEVSQWWYKWFGKAGHKRLGRILVSIAKEKEKEGTK